MSNIIYDGSIIMSYENGTRLEKLELLKYHLFQELKEYDSLLQDGGLNPEQIMMREQTLADLMFVEDEIARLTVTEE